jgi:hypothetical protein
MERQTYTRHKLKIIRSAFDLIFDINSLKTHISQFVHLYHVSYNWYRFHRAIGFTERYRFHRETDIGFTEQSKLNDHIQAIHEGKLFMCDHDNCKNHKGFTSRSNLRTHRLTHSGKRVKCTNSKCDETFSSHANMRNHCRKDHEDLIRGTFLNHMPLNSEPWIICIQAHPFSLTKLWYTSSSVTKLWYTSSSVFFDKIDENYLIHIVLQFVG